MCPLYLIPKIFIFNEEELRPELRAQRQLNKGRLPELVRYLTDNLENYVFSALTASIDGEVIFEPLGNQGEGNKVGRLQIPMSARFIINDGQHRRAAIERALKERPELGDETIAVVFFLDKGLERCQQMFADLNRYAIRPSRSLGLLYDHRDEFAALARDLVYRSPVFRDLVELEKTSLSPRSRRLFTLSSIYSATSELLVNSGLENFGDLTEAAIEYWDEVAKNLKEWSLVQQGKISAGEVRQDFINTHGVVLQALGRAGSALLADYPNSWKPKLKLLKELDWRRSNLQLWEGRAMIGGRVSKAQHNILLTSNAIKMHLGLHLSPEEQRVEDAYNRETDD
jgi:DNA sulfur modification protein DndB